MTETFYERIESVSKYIRKLEKIDLLRDKDIKNLPEEELYDLIAKFIGIKEADDFKNIIIIIKGVKPL